MEQKGRGHGMDRDVRSDGMEQQGRGHGMESSALRVTRYPALAWWSRQQQPHTAASTPFFQLASSGSSSCA